MCGKKEEKKTLLPKRMQIWRRKRRSKRTAKSGMLYSYSLIIAVFKTRSSSCPSAFKSQKRLGQRMNQPAYSIILPNRRSQTRTANRNSWSISINKSLQMGLKSMNSVPFQTMSIFSKKYSRDSCSKSLRYPPTLIDCYHRRLSRKCEEDGQLCGSVKASCEPGQLGMAARRSPALMPIDDNAGIV